MILKRKLNIMDFSILIVISIIFFIIQRATLKEKPVRYYRLKKQAAEQTYTTFKMLKEEFLKRGGEIDPVNDPGETGLIGVRMSSITTSEGDLSAKITAINPNFSALFVDIFKKLRLKKGDYIGVGMTGSFPGLNISVIIALQTLGLRPVIITSAGSSGWGANIPFWTYLDMENYLYKKGIIKHRTVATSIGGGDDIGRGLEQEGRELLKKAIDRNNIEIFIDETPLAKAVEKRMEIYNSLSKGKIKLFINIGGGIANFGVSDLYYYLKPGLNYPYDREIDFKLLPVKGVIVRFLERGIPVLNMHNIIDIAKKYKMPVAPAAIPEPGEGSLFFQKKYSTIFLLVQLFVFTVIIFIILKIDFLYFLRVKRKEESV